MIRLPRTRWARALLSLLSVLALALAATGLPGSAAAQSTSQVECTHPIWSADTVYVGGDEVTHNEHHWRAKWWTLGEEPGTTGEWGVWEDQGPCDDDGNGDPDDPPEAPVGLTVTATTATTVSLTWQAVATADSYAVFRGGSEVGTSTASSFTDRDLSPDTTYTYTVRARNAAGSSDDSASVSATTQDEDDPPGPFVDRRVGYFTQWGIYGRNFKVKDLVENGTAEKLTHINYAFGNVSPGGECFIVNQLGVGDAWADYQRGFTAAESVDGVGDVYDQELKGNFNQLRKLKELYPDLRVSISLGGWTWSRYFSDAALTPQSRQSFVASCIDLYLRGNLPVQGGEPPGGPGSAFGVFDGIDLDWEWPASEGNEGNIVRPEDRENFTALVQEFRDQLDDLEAETGRPYDLTAFVPADPAKIQAGFDVPQLMPNFDFVTVQGYDLHGAWEPTTNHQSNLFPAPGDPSPVTFSGDTAIQEYLNRGAPAGKLVLGVPYYGRGWTGVSAGPQGDGLFQGSAGAAPGTWEAGVDDFKVLDQKPGQRFRDQQTGAFWLYDGSQFWSYDDPQLLSQKMGYIKQHGLGGVMMWSLDGDDTQGSLIDAIDQGLS